MLRVVKKTLVSGLWVAAMAAMGCSSGGDGSTGNGTSSVPLTPAAYYNLNNGLCAEYAIDAGSLPSIGVHITTSTTPPGIELRRVRHGQQDENEFVSFDGGGGVSIAERQFQTLSGFTAEVFTTPLSYLPPPPLVNNAPALTSSSLCGGGSDCSTMGLSVSILGTRPYTGAYSVDGGLGDGGITEYKLDFVFSADNDAGQLEQRWIVPGIGFTDLYLPTDDGNAFADYLLVDIIPDSAGGCANH